MNFFKKLLERLFIRNLGGVLVNTSHLELVKRGQLFGQGYCRLGFGNVETSAFFGSHSPSYLNNEGSIYLSDGVTISPGFRILNRGKISIGAKTYINPNVIVRINQGLEIGDDCAISWGVTFMDHDAHSMNGNKNEMPIKIGNQVWIGANCTILKGVVLGDGCVVATGAVVSRSFPAHCLVGGVPARILKENIDWEL
jgi:acetyltransferase-like isoleucine patch superfamily enzyme